MAQPALVIIDVQNDYFPGGAYPLHDGDAVLRRIVELLGSVRNRNLPVVLVQHIARAAAPFFNADTDGVKIHPTLRAAAPGAPVVVKSHADSFLETTLQQTLTQLGADTLWVCGMMTQNCVTHTALSPAAQGYDVCVVGNACTTVDPMIHAIALSALRDRVPVIDTQALSGS